MNDIGGRVPPAVQTAGMSLLEQNVLCEGLHLRSRRDSSTWKSDKENKYIKVPHVFIVMLGSSCSGKRKYS
jgi:hypothetical protein